MLFFLQGEIFSQVNTELPVDEIVFLGISRSEQQKVVSLLSIKAGRFLTEEEVQENLEKIFELGEFESVKIYSAVENGYHDLIVDLKSYPQIQAIEFKGNKTFSAKELEDVLLSKRKKRLNMNTIKKDKDRLEQYYKKRKILFFEIESIYFKKGILFFEIKESYVRKIIVEGVHASSKSLIEREMVIRKGDILDEKKIEASLKNIEELDMFEILNYPKIKPTGIKNSYDIYFLVSEKKHNRIDIGLENDEDLVVAFLQGSTRYALIPTDRLIAKVQVANINKSFKINHYLLNYQQPWFLNRFKQHFTVKAWQSYKQEVLSSQIGSYRPQLIESLRKGWQSGFTFPLRNQLYHYDVFVKHESVMPRNLQDFNGYQLNSINQQVRYQSEAPQAIMKKGQFWNIRLENGGSLYKLNASGIKYWRLEAAYANYVPLKKWIVANQIQLSTFNSEEAHETLEVEQYILGGANTLRGYPDRSFPFVGPHRLLLNFELRRQFLKVWQFVVFSDVGKVNFESKTLVNIKGYQSSVGLGLRYFSTLGPIRLDCGVSERGVALHLTLGQLF